MGPSQRWWQSNAAQLLLITFAMWVGVFVSRTTVGPFQEAMRLDLGLTDHELALLAGPAHHSAAAIAAIPAGLMVDRWSRVRALSIFTFLTIVAVIAMALAPDFKSLFVARFVLGLVSMVPLIAAFSLIADLYSPETRGRATGVFLAGEVTGGPAAFAIGGVVIVMLGASGDAWRWAMLWMAVPALLLLPPLVLLREPPRTGSLQQKPKVKRSLVELWRFRTVVMPLIAARVMVWIADGSAIVWAAPLLQRKFDLPPERVGAVVGTTLLVAGVVAPLMAGVLNDFCQRAGGPRRTMLVLSGLSIVMTPLGFFALAPDALIASILLIAFLTTGVTISGAAMMVGNVVIPNELRGLFMSISVVVGTVVAGFAPLLVSTLTTAFGGPEQIAPAMTVVSVSATVVGFAIFIAGYRWFPRAAIT